MAPDRSPQQQAASEQEHGAIDGWIGDGTGGRAEHEEARRALRTLVGNVPGMVYRCLNNSQWTIKYVSEQCEALTGYRPEALIDDAEVAYGELVHPEDRTPVWNAVQQALEQREPYQLSYRLQRRDGRTAWVWEQGQGVFDSRGRVVALEGFVADITERKQLEQQLNHAQKMEAVGRLAGGVAHDFNNLVTIIGSYAALLHDDLPEGSSLRDDVDEIRHAVQRGSDLTRQLLAMSRKQVSQPRVVDINDVVRGAQKVLGRLGGEHVDLRTKLQPDLQPVWIDPGQLEQILMNLVTNARDAMADGGAVTIETRNVELDEAYARQHADVEAGSYVQVAVSDTGAGMDKVTQQQIFEPFFTTKGEQHGTGLGLSIIYGIVRQNGGYIWVYSEPGRGTTFKTYLPCARREADQEIVESPAVDRLEGTETILVAEDEDRIRELCRRVLARYGYTVLEAADAAEAQQLARRYSGPVHLLLTDVVMPGASGAELAHTLKAARPATRLLFMSGYADGRVFDMAQEARASFVAKPFTPKSLVRKVRAVLDEG